MKYIFGLGNPGKKYQQTRHNAGFMVLDHLAEDSDWKKSKWGRLEYLWKDFGQNKCELIKPQTFMNESGISVAYVEKKHPDFDPADVYVVHDDLDLELGQFKIQLGTGPQDHNGLLSIYQHLGIKDFWHVRVGVDSRQGRRNIPADQYVLKKLSGPELKNLQNAVTQVVSKLELVLSE